MIVSELIKVAIWELKPKTAAFGQDLNIQPLTVMSIVR